MMKRFFASLMAAAMLAMPMTCPAETPSNLVQDAMAAEKSVSVDAGFTVSSDVYSLVKTFDSTGIVSGCLDLLGAIGFNATLQQDQVSLALTMSDTPLLSLDAAWDDNALYVRTEGMDKPLVVDQNEISGLVQEFVVPYMEEHGMDADAIQMVNSLAEVFRTDGISGVVQAVTGKTPEELMESLSNADSETLGTQFSFENTAPVLMGILTKVSEAEVTDAELPGKAAASCVTFSLNADELVALAQAVIKDLSASGLAEIADEQLEGTTAEEACSTLSDKVTEAIQSMQPSLTASVYLDEDNNLADLSLVINATHGDVDSTLTVDAYASDAETGTAGGFSAELRLGEDYAISLSGISSSVEEADATVTTNQISLKVAGEELLTVDNTSRTQNSDLPSAASSASATLHIMGVDLAVGANASVTTEMNGDDFVMEYALTPFVNALIANVNLGTFHVTVSSGAPAASITEGGVLRLSEMDQEAREALKTQLTTVSDERFSALVSAIPQSLKDAVKNLFAPVLELLK